MNYLRKIRKPGLLYGAVILAFNLYFVFLMQDRHVGYLLYLDLLVFVFTGLAVAADFLGFWKKEKEKEQLLMKDWVIYAELPPFENREVAEHDVQVLQKELKRQAEENLELQDYVTRWCHEFKLPVAAGLLLTEEIKDPRVRISMREQFERMNQQAGAMLLGCRLQSSLLDIQVKPVSVKACVRRAIKNNQFFFIQKGFAIEDRAEDIMVYSDEAWLVYVLDQLFQNAIKYTRGGEPKVCVWTEEEWTEDKEPKRMAVRLFVEDNGEGIKDSDIRRIFEKGFTGSSYHNGKYKSTGMGLYMAAKILGKLGHAIDAESEYGAYTRFCICFRENDYFQI